MRLYTGNPFLQQPPLGRGKHVALTPRAPASLQKSGKVSDRFARPASSALSQPEAVAEFGQSRFPILREGRAAVVQGLSRWFAVCP